MATLADRATVAGRPRPAKIRSISRAIVNEPLTTKKLSVLVVICLLPFVQIGLSYWVSVGVAAIVILVLAYARVILQALARVPHQLYPVPLMLLSMAGGNGARGDWTEDLLRILREALFFTLTIGAAIGLARARPLRASRSALRCLLVVVSLMLMLVFYQIHAISQIRYYGLPADWFVANAATLPDELDLIYSKIRPSGTFGEPSYLGFYLFSVLTMISPMLTKSRLAQLVGAVALIGGLLSESVSFVLALGVLALTLGFTAKGSFKQKFSRVALLGSGVLVALLWSTQVQTRLFNVGTGSTDSSIQTRLIVPLLLLPQYLGEFPLGQSVGSLPGILKIMAARMNFGYFAPSDNALANLLFQYGFVGIAVLVAVITSTNSPILRHYLMVAMIFNGTFLSYDKCATFIAVFVIHGVMSDEAARRGVQLARRRLPPRPT